LITKNKLCENLRDLRDLKKNFPQIAQINAEWKKIPADRAD
jgi:hypothetical protein